MISAARGGLTYGMARNSHCAIVCDASALKADLASADRLARLQLAAKRIGMELRLRRAPAELRALLTLIGLAEALGVEPVGQPEQREDALGVEEERHVGDPPV
jgi:hypothetical protein